MKKAIFVIFALVLLTGCGKQNYVPIQATTDIKKEIVGEEKIETFPDEIEENVIPERVEPREGVIPTFEQLESVSFYWPSYLNGEVNFNINIDIDYEYIYTGYTNTEYTGEKYKTGFILDDITTWDEDTFNSVRYYHDLKKDAIEAYNCYIPDYQNDSDCIEYINEWNDGYWRQKKSKTNTYVKWDIDKYSTKIIPLSYLSENGFEIIQSNDEYIVQGSVNYKDLPNAKFLDDFGLTWIQDFDSDAELNFIYKFSSQTWELIESHIYISDLNSLLHSKTENDWTESYTINKYDIKVRINRDNVKDFSVPDEVIASVIESEPQLYIENEYKFAEDTSVKNKEEVISLLQNISKANLEKPNTAQIDIKTDISILSGLETDNKNLIKKIDVIYKYDSDEEYFSGSFQDTSENVINTIFGRLADFGPEERIVSSYLKTDNDIRVAYEYYEPFHGWMKKIGKAGDYTDASQKIIDLKSNILEMFRFEKLYISDVEVTDDFYIISGKVDFSNMALKSEIDLMNLTQFRIDYVPINIVYKFNKKDLMFSEINVFIDEENLGSYLGNTLFGSTNYIINKYNIQIKSNPIEKDSLEVPSYIIDNDTRGTDLINSGRFTVDGVEVIVGKSKPKDTLKIADVFMFPDELYDKNIKMAPCTYSILSGDDADSSYKAKLSYMNNTKKMSKLSNCVLYSAYICLNDNINAKDESTINTEHTLDLFGLNWGSSYEEIKNVLGEANFYKEPPYSYEINTTLYYYYTDKYTLVFEVHDKLGLFSIDYEVFFDNYYELEKIYEEKYADKNYETHLSWLEGDCLFDIWAEDIEITTTVLIFSIFVLFPLQLIFCFIIKNKAIRLLPIILLSISSLTFIIMSITEPRFDSLKYIFLAIFAGFMMLMCGIAWGIWTIIKRKQKKKQINSTLKGVL